MSVGVMRDPPFVATQLRWYSPAHTTPFALAGYIGPLLAQVDPDKYGGQWVDVWFGDNGWETPEGASFDEDDILAFAMPEVPSVVLGSIGKEPKSA